MTVRLDVPAIRKMMAEKRLTSAATARLMGISPQAFSAAMGRGTFTHINAALLADALGVEFEDVQKGV